MSKGKVVVVGAGPGGLTSAMLLATRGFEVQVFEKEPVLGGRNAALKLGDYTFDIGPTFFMMKFILDQIFKETGRQAEDYLDFKLLDPMYRLQFEDREIYISSDTEKMQAEIDRHFPGNEGAVQNFLSREEKRLKKLLPCLQRPYSSWTDLLAPEVLQLLPRLSLGRSLFDVLGDYFSEEQLKLSFTFQAKYLGMSPWECPGAFAIIPFIEHNFGIYHIQGGLNQISEMMGKIVQEEGGQIHTSTPVSKIMVKEKRACGVELEDGTRVEADKVIINADFAHAMNELFDPGVLKKYNSQALERKKYSCSTFMLYLGLDREYDINHHNIVFARNYRENVDDIFKNFKLSDDMSIYIQNPTITDPGLAPAGHSALYILVPIANRQAPVEWNEQQVKYYRDLVLQTIKEKTSLKDIEEHIVQEKAITPLNWEQDFSVYRGATFNLGHNLSQMLYFRPRNRFEELDDCFLVGGGTNPGSGLPTIYESGRIATRLICSDYNLPYDL